MKEASAEALDETYAFTVRIGHEEAALPGASRIFPLVKNANP